MYNLTKTHHVGNLVDFRDMYNTAKGQIHNFLYFIEKVINLPLGYIEVE